MVERNPKYDGCYVYVIDLSKLKPGDVLLTRNAETSSMKAGFQSSAIAKATRGTYSHAMLCTVPPTFIEAVGRGVSNVSAQRCFVHDLNNVRMLRYTDAAIAKNAGSYALPYLGQHYSIKKAVQSILPGERLSKVNDDKLFCSALVAAAYRKAGAKELANIDPMKVTPATLEKAKYFTNVTEDVFVQILAPSNIEEMSALDGDRRSSLVEQEVHLFQEFGGILLPKVREFINTTPEITFKLVPTTFLDCLPFIEAARRFCDERPAFQDATKKIAEIDDAAYSLLADGRFEKIRADAMAHDEAEIRYTIEQSLLPKPDINYRETRALIAATKQQIALRSGKPRGPEISRVAKKWQELNDEAVEFLKRRLIALEESFQRVFPGEQL
jgi:uncharacterized protein YycO